MFPFPPKVKGNWENQPQSGPSALKWGLFKVNFAFIGFWVIYSHLRCAYIFFFYLKKSVRIYYSPLPHT